MGLGMLSRVTSASSLKPDSIGLPIDDMTESSGGSQFSFLSNNRSCLNVIKMLLIFIY